MREIEQIRRALRMHMSGCKCLQHLLMAEYDAAAGDMVKLRDCVVDLIALHAGSATIRSYAPPASTLIEKARTLVEQTADRALLTEADKRMEVA